MICAIHQPNFFPWLGFFDKIKKSDVFILMDDVQNPKTGSSWTNRVKLACNNQPKWFTCPFKRFSGVQKINQLEMVNDAWKEQLLQVLQNYYKKTLHFKSVYKIVEDILRSNQDNGLCNFNIHVIKSLSAHLGIKGNFVLQSELNVEGSSTQLLIGLTKAVGADTYLCGGGADGYQEDQLFKQQGISLQYQSFEEKECWGGQEFIPGLSVIHYMMLRG